MFHVKHIIEKNTENNKGMFKNSVTSLILKQRLLSIVKTTTKN